MSSDEPDDLPAFGPMARSFMRAGQAAVLANLRLRGGAPQAATCVELRRSARRRREVAKAVHRELVGMEESWRRVLGPEGLTPVAVRFPGGWRDVEPLVHDACAGADATARPFRHVLEPLCRELGFVGSGPN